MPAFLETGLNLVDVEDVARGHLLAAERGRIGEKYILGGENLTLQQMLGRLGEAVRRAGAQDQASRTRWPMASRLAPKRLRAPITHRPPRASLTEVRMARKKMFFDSSKAAIGTGLRAAWPIDGATARDRVFSAQRDGARAA